ncbi:MAG: hypothetical protein PsegKO_33150 [Pseudohongiellaceae bacterium]
MIIYGSNQKCMAECDSAILSEENPMDVARQLELANERKDSQVRLVFDGGCLAEGSAINVTRTGILDSGKSSDILLLYWADDWPWKEQHQRTQLNRLMSEAQAIVLLEPKSTQNSSMANSLRKYRNKTLVWEHAELRVFPVNAAQKAKKETDIRDLTALAQRIKAAENVIEFCAELQAWIKVELSECQSIQAQALKETQCIDSETPTEIAYRNTMIHLAEFQSNVVRDVKHDVQRRVDDETFSKKVKLWAGSIQQSDFRRLTFGDTKAMLPASEYKGCYNGMMFLLKYFLRPSDTYVLRDEKVAEIERKLQEWTKDEIRSVHDTLKRSVGGVLKNISVDLSGAGNASAVALSERVRERLNFHIHFPTENDFLYSKNFQMRFSPEVSYNVDCTNIVTLLKQARSQLQTMLMPLMLLTLIGISARAFLKGNTYFYVATGVLFSFFLLYKIYTSRGDKSKGHREGVASVREGLTVEAGRVGTEICRESSEQLDTFMSINRPILQSPESFQIFIAPSDATRRKMEIDKRANQAAARTIQLVKLSNASRDLDAISVRGKENLRVDLELRVSK